MQHVRRYKMTVFGTDLAFLCDTRRSAAALSDLGIDVYVYQFDFHDANYKDPRSEPCYTSLEVGCGVFHTTELKYVWDRASDTEPDRKMSRMFGEWWTSFAFNGSPSAGGVVAWPRYTSTAQEVVKINEVPSVTRGLPPFSQCAVWDSLPLY